LKPFQPSLRGRLMAMIGLSLLVLWGIVSLWMLIDVRQQVLNTLDDRLAASARMVASLVAGLPAGTPPDIEHLPLDVVGRDGLACEVSLLRGEVTTQPIARTAGSPGLERIEPGFGYHNYGGKRWRTYVLVQNGVRIATADRIEMRNHLLQGIALTVAVPFAIAFIGSLLALRFGIHWGLAPLEQLRRTLEARSPDDDTPLPRNRAPTELRPLTRTLDNLLCRVRQALALERRFTDAAGHELRTPLAGVKLHMQVANLALLQGRPAEIEAALQGASVGVERMEHLLAQLLTLARIEGGQHGTDTAAIASVIHTSVGTLQPEQRARLQVELNCLGHLRVAIPEELMAVALRNLLDNAMRYTPEASPVILRVSVSDRGGVSLCVQDRGPGMSAEACEQAVKRFWRGAGVSSRGSGLGLAIVKAIMDRYGGKVSIKADGDQGLRACLDIAPTFSRETASLEGNNMS